MIIKINQIKIQKYKQEIYISEPKNRTPQVQR